MPHEQPGFSVETTDDWVPGLLTSPRAAAPRIADAGIKRRLGRAVRDDARPQRDHRRGRAAWRRFLYATGFSGHGFLQGPAVGEILRDLVLRPPAVRGHRDR